MLYSTNFSIITHRVHSRIVYIALLQQSVLIVIFVFLQSDITIAKRPSYAAAAMK